MPDILCGELSFFLLCFLLQISRVLFSLSENFSYCLPQIHLVAYFNVLAPEAIMPWAMKAHMQRLGKASGTSRHHFN